MSNLQVRIPKALVSGILATLAAAILVPLAVYKALLSIPSSPYYKLNELAAINNDNPAINSSQAHEYLARQTGSLDSFVITPLTLLLAGAAFGYFLAKLPWTRGRQMRAGAITAVIFSSVIVGMVLATILLIPRLLALANHAGRQYVPPHLTSELIMPVLLQFVLSVAAYMAGVWLTTLKPRGSASTSKPVAAEPIRRKSGAV